MKQSPRNRKLREYRQLNALCRRHGAVLFGSTFAAGIHASELAQDFALSRPVYNRSLEALSLFEADQVLDACVLDLEPDTVFVNLGETDLRDGGRTQEDLLARYEWILGRIRAARRGCELCLVSLCSDHPSAPAFNQALKGLARTTGCRYVDIAGAAASEHPELRAFSILRSCLRTHRLSFGEAMGIVPEVL